MRLLLDTHVLIWMRNHDARLSRAKWEPVFLDPDNEILFSVVSLWEIAIKRALGKLALEGGLTDFARQLEDQHGFSMLPLEGSALDRLDKLPPHHGDPFDRLLIAQAIEEGAVAITNDRNWLRYAVKTRW